MAVGRPHNDIVKLINQVDQLMDAIKELQRCKANLGSRELQLLVEQDQEWKLHERWLLKIIVQYSKSWNLRFANIVQTRLSRELRDMIHAHLWMAKDTVEKYEGLMSAITVKQSSSVKYSALITYRALFRGFPIINKNYVGSTTACEAVDAMYRALPLFAGKTPLTIRLDDVPYVCGDPFNIGHNGTSALRQFKIVCKIDRYRTRNKCRARASCTHTASERVYTYRENIRHELAPLLQVAKKRNFQLELLFIQRNIRLGVLSEVLDAFSEVYWAFETAGANVTVTWQYADKSINGPVTWGPNSTLTYETHKLARDVKPFFEMHRSNWRAETLLDFQDVS